MSQRHTVKKATDTGKTKIANHFIYLFHEGSPKAIQLFDGLVVGRTEGNENYPTDSLLSRRHCKFSVDKGNSRIEITDLNSTNGTRINGITLPQKPVPFRVGEVLEVGNQRFMLTDSPSRNPFLSPISKGISHEPRTRLGRSTAQAIEPGEEESSLDRLFYFLPPWSWNPAFSALAAGIVLFSLMGYFGILGRIHHIAHPTVSVSLLKNQLQKSLIYPTMLSLMIAFFWVHFQSRGWFSRTVAFFGSSFLYFGLVIVWFMANGTITTIESQRINSACFEDGAHSECTRTVVDVLGGKPRSYIGKILSEIPPQNKKRMEDYFRRIEEQRKASGKLAALEAASGQ